MTDTKKPADPVTATAPLNRPMAETVSLELVWAAAYAARAEYLGCPLDESETRDAVDTANEAVAALLAAHPRGAR